MKIKKLSSGVKIRIFIIICVLFIISLGLNIHLSLLPGVEEKAFDLGSAKAYFQTGRDNAINQVYNIAIQNGFVEVPNPNGEDIKLILEKNE